MVTGAANDPDLPGATPNFQTIPAGSLVVPMCTNLQALAGTPFNMKSYGLINALLHANIPVKWAIAAGKAKDGIDFTANASRILPTSTTATNVSFRCGPFIVHRDYTNQAMSIITNWDNKVAIYRLNADTMVDVRYTVCHKPRVAVLDDGKTQTIQTSILDEAGVPTNNYIVLHAADVSFLAASDCYTLVTSPHFEGGVTATNQTHSIRDFVMNGGNFLAQCAAVDTYEDNILYGYFQTTKGVTIDNVAKSFVYRNPDMAFNQFQGELANEGGHTQEWDLSTGSSFTNHGYVGVLNGSDTNNIRSAVAKLFPGKPGSVVFYLGGHTFAGSTLPYYNGRRMYMNALFVPPDRPAGCVIVFQTDLCIHITNNFSGVTNGQNINYTIVVSNCGPGRVESASVTDFFPATLENVSWTSVTNGGAVADSTAGSGDIGNIVSMPILSSITYTVNATVSQTATVPIVDTATVSLPIGMTDLTPSDNAATITNRLVAIPKPPPDVTVSCVAEVPSAATNISQFLAQGGVAVSQMCGQTTTVAWNGDASNGGLGCVGSPLVFTRSYTVITGCGDVSTVTQEVTIIDSIAPTILNFPADATFSCASQVPAADDTSVVASDNCVGQVTVTHDADVITAGGCPNRFTIARTYHVSDSCGNNVSRTQQITVNDETAPVITVFPIDATYSCPAAVPPANDSLVTATDDCGGLVVVSHDADVVTSSNCLNRFTISRTYRATDSCGNSTSRTQSISVNGTTPPTFTAFPADATYSCASAVPVANDGDVFATNACGGTSGVVVTHNPDVIASSNCVNRFTVSRTYVATDPCGNSSSRTQTITVNGTTTPTITTFPPDETYSCASAVPPANDSLVSAVDGCGGTSSLRISHTSDNVSSSNCVNRLTISRTYIATDACGNSASKTQTITVNATNAPTITAFPNDATYQCSSLVPAADDTQVAATDSCGSSAPATISHLPDVISSSNCVSRFTISRTYIATDACGNSISKTQSITVDNTTPPQITGFPSDASYSCAGSVPPANDSLVAAIDNCGALPTVTHDVDLIAGSNCPNHFTITRTYRVTDACGNSTSRSQTITVSDTTPPMLAKPLPLVTVTYSCASEVPPANDSMFNAFDNCGGRVVVTHDPDTILSSNCVNQFMIRRVYHITDACGNSTNFTQTLRVNNLTAPTITAFPNDATFQCSSQAPAADDTKVSATDGCGGVPVLISHLADVISSSNCVSRFTISRTYIATDACGNSASRTQTIIIDNTTPPQITSFPANASYSCASLVPLPNDSLVTAVDNCGALPTVTHDNDLITESNCPNHFTVTRTYRVTDACGNSTSRSQTITVNDKTAPRFILPLPPLEPVYSCASDVPAADDSILHATDNCGGGVIVTHEPDVLVSSNCVNRFTLRRVYHVADSCGNTTNFTQTIHVNSTTAPTITAFPADTTYTCSSAVPSADDSLVTAIDGCGTGQIHISHGADAISSATCDNRYVIQRTYTAVDACGNSSSKTQTITINNTTPPTITQFPPDATYSCSGDVPPATDSLVIATNACGDGFGMVITHSPDVINSSNCVSRFTIARTYTATDNCGNSSSRTQTITVNATTPPTITTFPVDATYACANAVPPADNSLVTAGDGCGGTLGIVISHNADTISSSNCVNRFTITRTYIATDACGNSTSKIQTLTVNGITPPTITAFPADATFACAGLVPAADDTLVSAKDNCGAASVTVNHDSDVIVSNICVNQFVVLRTYHVTDACGNVTNKTQTITVNDNIAPEISCPPGFTVSLFDDVPFPNIELVTASDNCGIPSKAFLGETYVTNNNIVTITRVFVATDDCGNSSTCSQVITMNPYLATGTAKPDFYSTFENQTLNVAAPGVLGNDTDPNNLPLQAILVTNPTNGTLTLNGNGSFQYVPNTNFNGNDSFIYQASNGGTTTAPVVVLITVTFVNQAPSFTKGPNQIVNNYDPTQTRIGWASNIKPGPANESSQTVQFIVSNDNNAIFSVQPAINPNGTLTYAPAAGHYGTAIVSVKIKDNGGTANGGIDTSATQMFSIIVNNPPTAAINMPTNTSLFLYPSPVDIIATATDIDGTVTNVTFLNGTNVIGQGTPADNNFYTFTWTNAPFSNSVLYALATDNYGATNLSPPIHVQLGNPVNIVGGPVGFSPSLLSWAEKFSVTNPTISIVQSVTITFTTIGPAGTSIVGVTGTNQLGQPYITFNTTVPPVTGIDNYATILFVATSQPIVTFTTSASLSPGPGFTVTPNKIVPITREQFQNDGSLLLNFSTQTNHFYFVQYTKDFQTWFTSPVALRGNGTTLQWLDFGPNVTESRPRTVPYRFYRAVAQ